MSTPEFGPTGRFPHGKLAPDDEGELRAGVTVVGDKVVINFGTPVTWLAITGAGAIELAEVLRTRGEQALAHKG